MRNREFGITRDLAIFQQLLMHQLIAADGFSSLLRISGNHDRRLEQARFHTCLNFFTDIAAQSGIDFF